MHPVLFRIGSLEIRTYGVILIIAFLAGIWWVSRKLKPYGVSSDDVWNLTITVVIAGIVGARIAFVIQHWPYFSRNIGEAFAVWHGGLTYYGGFLGALPAGIAYACYKRFPLRPTLDAVAQALALGIFIGRWACFFNGCCYGHPTGVPWCIVYPPEHETYPACVHPSPLYESFGNLIAFGILLILERKKPWPGFIFAAYLFMQPLVRFLVDFTRWYEPSAFVGPLTFNQWIALGLMATGVGLMALWRPRSSG